MDMMTDPFRLIDDEPTPKDIAPKVHAVRSDSGEHVENLTPSNTATCHFHGFDFDDCPLVSGFAPLANEILRARTTVALTREQIGSTVLVVVEPHNIRSPIIIGALLEKSSLLHGPVRSVKPTVQGEADGERFEITAEREIVLRCGDASITLTRAGKVIIRGNYIVSRSTGYNKLKGSAVHIN